MTKLIEGVRDEGNNGALKFFFDMLIMWPALLGVLGVGFGLLIPWSLGAVAIAVFLLLWARKSAHRAR